MKPNLIILMFTMCLYPHALFAQEMDFMGDMPAEQVHTAKPQTTAEPKTTVERGIAEVDQEEFAVVKKASLPLRQVIVIMNGTATKGAELTVLFKPGQKCYLTVLAVRGNMANLNTAGCKFAPALTPGLKLTIEKHATVANTNDKELGKEERVASHPSGYARELTDLLYQPDRGQFYLKLSYKGSQTSGVENDTRTSLVVQRDQTYVDAFDGAMGYGVTKQFSVTLNFGYVTSSIVTSTLGSDILANGIPADGLVTSTNSSGLIDPTIVGQYRIFEQDQTFFTVDVDAAYSPNAMDSVVGTPANNGTVGRGSDAATFAVLAGRKNERMGFDVSGGATFFGAKSSSNADTNASVESGTGTLLTFSGMGQVRLMERIFVRAGATENVVSSSTISIGGVQSRTFSGYNQTVLSGAIVGEILAKQLIAIAGIEQKMSTPITGTWGAVSFNENLSGTLISVALAAQF